MKDESFNSNFRDDEPRGLYFIKGPTRTVIPDYIKRERDINKHQDVWSEITNR